MPLPNTTSEYVPADNVWFVLLVQVIPSVLVAAPAVSPTATNIPLPYVSPATTFAGLTYVNGIFVAVA